MWPMAEWEHRSQPLPLERDRFPGSGATVSLFQRHTQMHVSRKPRAEETTTTKGVPPFVPLGRMSWG